MMGIIDVYLRYLGGVTMLVPVKFGDLPVFVVTDDSLPRSYRMPARQRLL